jgi:uncharacterized protein (TIGR02217 family)
MAFHEVRLSEDIERGATGGPEFRTRVLLLESGFEQRNIDWSVSRGSWDIGYGIMLMDDDQACASLHEIRDFFYARQGRAHGFRFKDWSDFEIGDPSDAFNTRQLIGLGDDATTAFQSFARYTSGGVTYDRTTKKLVTGTVRAWMDTTELTLVGGAPAAGQFAVDVDTGIITTGDVFASTGGTGPGGEEVLSIVAEFDTPVRFDDDKLDISVVNFNVGSIPRIPIIEIRIA